MTKPVDDPAEPVDDPGQPFDDPKVIAERAARAARTALKGAAEVANEAFKEINPPDGGPSQFTAGKAIRSLSRLFAIATTGTIGIIRAPLQAQPENGPLLLADHIAGVADRTAKDVKQVAEEAAAQLDSDSFKQSQWLDAAVKLTSIAMIRAAEVAETVGAGPGRYGNTLIESDPYPVHFDDDGELAFDHRLVITELRRPGLPGENIAKLATFDHRDGVLPAGTTNPDFKLKVNSAGIASGLYQGDVQVFRNDQDPDQDDAKATVRVTIVL